jgi:hypothetical protein
MSVPPNIAKTQAAVGAEVGKLEKLFASIKKVVAAEFLWLVLALVMGLPLALVLQYIINQYGLVEVIIEFKKLTGMDSLFVNCCIATMSGIYFSRALANSLIGKFKKGS